MKGLFCLTVQKILQRVVWNAFLPYNRYMNKYFFLGAAEALLLLLPVPLTLVALSFILPLEGAFLGAGILAGVLLHRWALPLLSGKKTLSRH